jgi:hypothetical protein
MKFKFFISGCIFFISFHANAQLFTPEFQNIQEEIGVYGYFCPLFGYINYENNLFHKFGVINSSPGENNNLLSPPIKQNSFVFSVPFELGYTVRPQKTSFYLKNIPEDYLLYETSQQIGIKQRLNANGILNVGFIYYDLGTKVWKDPFNLNQINNSTSRKGIGFETSISEISGTGLSIKYKYRSFEVQDENSGLVVDLLPEQLIMLNRNGSRHAVSILYKYQYNEKHQVEPLFRINKRLSKGSAIAYTGYKAGLKYNLINKKFLLSAYIYSLYFTFDEENPIYNVKQEDQAWEIMTLLAVDNPWDIKIIGDKVFRFTLRTGYNYRLSNIDYFSTRSMIIQTGLCFLL